MYDSPSSASKLGRLIGFIAGFALFLGLVASPLVVAARAFKPGDLPGAASVATNTTIYDDHGNPIAELHGEENRVAISRNQMPISIRQAVVAAEDRRFYEHGGVSLGGIVRALTTDVNAGDALQGGSTITQQYARNAFDQVGTARTVHRKLTEALLAVRLENQYSKEHILDD